MSTVEHAHTAPPITGDELKAEEPRRRRRRLVWFALGAIAIVVGGGAWLWTSNASIGSAPAAAGPVATATVVRGSISATESWDGTLEYGKPFTVASGRAGTVTRLAEQGQTVERGDELFRVDERPVTLLYGAVPMYRNLVAGDSGVDVRQLEANLAKLGYGGFTADDEYTSSTAGAVRRWQADIGAEPTGMVSPATVVFMLEGGRIEGHRVEIGARVAPGTPIVDITGTDQVISLDVDVEDRNRFDAGAKVTIVLPGGNEVQGTVSNMVVTKVASDDSGGGGAGTEDSESIARVEISLDKGADDELVGAPVEVVVAIDERKDVLLVPINALLALAEGGYGLEVVRDDGTTSIVAVKTGLFADGKVQVEGGGIAEGTVVGVAGR